MLQRSGSQHLQLKDSKNDSFVSFRPTTIMHFERLSFEEDEEDPFKEDLVQFCIETFVPFVPSCLCCTSYDL